MKKTFSLLILLTFVGVLTQTPAWAQTQAESTAIEQDVLKVMADITAASENLDASQFSKFVLENGTTIMNGRLYLSREEAQKIIASTYQAVSKQKITVQHHVTVLSPTLVLVVSDGDARATLADGTEVGPIPFAQTVVLTLKEGKWKVLHAHSSAIRPR